jgi:hypothetical protein
VYHPSPTQDFYKINGHFSVFNYDKDNRFIRDEKRKNSNLVL